MSTSNVDLVKALGAGSGVDTKALAKGLVDAEGEPRKEAINAKLTRSETRISGYAALKYALSQLGGAFEKLNDQSDFGTPTVSVNQSAALSVTATGSAQIATHSVEVTRLASAQRSASGGFSGASDAFNGGSGLSLSLSVHGGAPQTISVTTDTPNGVASAINAAGLGLSAQVVRTDSSATPYRIVVTGQTGGSQDFTLTSSAAGLAFGSTLASAADAQLTVNGLSVTRSSNSVNDVIDGVTLQLQALTSGPARVDLSRDTQSAKANITGLVSAYNDFNETLKILGDSGSDVEGLGGSLAGDSLLRTIRNQVRNLLVGNSSTPSGEVSALRDVGISFDRNGKMTLDASKLDTALASKFSDVAQMFSAGTSNKSLFSPSPAGVAGDVVVAIDKLQRATGLIASQTESATRDVTKYKAQLTALQERMDKLLENYTKQFAAMESVVGNSNSLKTSLSSSFEAMMNSYKN